MRIMKQITLGLALRLVLVTVGTGLLCAAPANAAGTLDQSQPISQSPRTVGDSDYQQAQIFTAGAYGRLDRVSLRLENYWSTLPAGAVLNVSLQTVIGGMPSGKQLGSGSLAFSEIPYYGSGGDWVDVSISGAGAVVTPGTQYAIVLQTNLWNAEVNWWYAYQNAYGSSYTRGQIAYNYGDGWSIDTSNDYAFKTYVIPDGLDQRQTIVSGYGGGPTMAQIFTAGQSGAIDRVDAYLEMFNNNLSPYDVTIQTVKSGYPSGTVLGSGSITPAMDTWWIYGHFFTIAINGAQVSAGTKYALVIHARQGNFTWGWQWYYWWNDPPSAPYTGGQMLYQDAQGWKPILSSGYPVYAGFQTWVAPPLPPSPTEPPPVITPCSSGVCPTAAGNVSPQQSTGRVNSNAAFEELPDGTIHGVLNFNDSRTGDLVLHGCTTESANCRLTVTTFACTDQHSIMVAGTYTHKGEAAANYQLILSGVSGGTGTFTLTAGDYTYTLSHMGIVDVACPSGP